MPLNYTYDTVCVYAQGLNDISGGSSGAQKIEKQDAAEGGHPVSGAEQWRSFSSD